MKNNKGFTLVELLAVIVIVGLVVGITAYISINAINSAKEKSYQVTINNIEKNAGNYLLENSDKLSFIAIGDDSGNEYQCVTIKELVELGYLKSDVVNSPVAKDVNVGLNNYVYLERNINTKSITKAEYDYTNTLNSTCILAVNAIGTIQFISNPGSNVWSQKKNITAYYKVKNITANEVDNLKYTYRFEDEEGNAISINNACLNGCSDNNAIKGFEVTTGNIYIHAYIKDGENIAADATYKIDKIDNTKPQISMIDYEKVETTGEIKITFRVEDEGSGINYDKNGVTFTKDVLTVKKDTTVINSNSLTLTLKENNSNMAIYELTINDSSINGTVSISVPNDKIYDNALNSNESETFNININSTGKVNIKYDMNGGTWGTHGDAYSNNGSIITKNELEVFHTVEYGKTLGTSGLYNWNNSNHINLVKTGSTVIEGKEWCTNPDGSGNCYNQDTVYPASRFCDASNGDCTVVLYANWASKPIIIYYHQNDGTISGYCRAGSGSKLPCKSRGGWAAVCEKDSCSDASDLTYAYQLCTYGSTCDLLDYNNTNFLNITRTGYTAVSKKEWCTKKDGTGACFDHDPSTDYTYADLVGSVTKEQDNHYELSLYVNWKETTCIIKFTDDRFKYKVNDVQYNANTNISVPCNTRVTVEALVQDCSTRFDWWLGNPIDGDKSNPKKFTITSNVTLAISDWNGCGGTGGGSSICGACNVNADCRSGTCTGTCSNANGSYRCCILSDNSMCN